MSSEGLDTLSHHVDKAYQRESRSLKRSRYGRRMSGDSVSVRDIHHMGSSIQDAICENAASRKDMLAAWQNMIDALQQEQVFLQYVDALQRLFDTQESCSTIEEDVLLRVTRSLEALTVIVENHAEPQTECCYVTILEVVASYFSNWQLSAELEVMWNGFGQPVEVDTPPHQFRSMAYNMLMSLKWVPSSLDLHWICHLEEDGTDLMDAAATPQLAIVKPLFEQIRSSVPLPRHDLCNRIVRRLTDDSSPITVAISSEVEDTGFEGPPKVQRGLGKTTLAAMVACQVQEQFCVLWISLRASTGHSSEMTFQKYTQYLNSLCEQLCVKPTWPCRSYELESKSLALKREEERVLQAKRQMKGILERVEKDVLIVVDQVRDDDELNWFRFLDSQSLLVTTETNSISVDWAVEVDVFTESEAIELFLTESDYPPSHVLSNSLEVKSTVQRCNYHPLTIRTVARWFRLKKMAADEVRGLEELTQELSSCATKIRHSPTADSAVPSHFLNEVMDLMLTPILAADGQPTKLMKLCLTSMAVVFSCNKVQMEVVYGFWGQLFKTEPDATTELGAEPSESEIKKHVRVICHALVSLGLVALSQEQGCSKMWIHHDLQLEYALSLLKTMEFTGECTQEEIVRQWHKAIAEMCWSYYVDKGEHGSDDAYRRYAAEHLVSHMFKAKMWQGAVTILKNEGFLQDRLMLHGWLEGIERHIDDCQELEVLMKRHGAAPSEKSGGLPVINLDLAVFLGRQAKDTHPKPLETAKALNCVGFTLSQKQCWSDAIECCKAAIKMIPSPCVLLSRVLCSIGMVHLANQDPRLCLKKLNESLKILEGMDGSSHEHDAVLGSILQKVGESMVLLHDYRSAIGSYGASLEAFQKDPDNNRVDIGKVLLRKGALQGHMGEFSGAIRALKRCIKWKSNLGESNGDLAMAYSYLGNAQLEKGATADASKCFKHASRLMTSNLNEIEEFDLYVTSGKFRMLQDDYDGCRNAFDSALSGLDRSSSSQLYKQHSYNICWIARILMDNDDDESVPELLDRCLRHLEATPNCLEMAYVLFCKGEYCLRHCKEDALAFFERALEIRMDKLDVNECVIDNFKKIGHLHISNGETGKAEELYLQALQMAEKAHGDANQEVASVLYEMGKLMKIMNEQSEALAIFTECLDVQKRTLGDIHPDVACTLHSMGAIHADQDSFEEANRYYSEALEIRLENSQVGDAAVAETMHELGFVSRNCGDSERALQLLLDALNLRKESDRTRETCETLAEIGHVHRVLNDPESAIGCYERCLGMMIHEFGDEEEVIGDVYQSLGHSKKRVGQTEDAVTYYQRALDVRLVVHDNDHHKVAASRRSLGIMHFQLGNLEDAASHLDEYVRISETTDHTSSMDHVLVLQILGDIHESNKHYNEAHAAWSSALRIFVNNDSLVKKNPELGENLERRLRSKCVAPEQPSFFQKLSDGFNRLSDETNTSVEEDPQEDVDDLIRRANFMDD